VSIEAEYFGLNADYTRAGRDRKVTEGIAATELTDSGKHPAIHPGRQTWIFRTRRRDTTARVEALEPRGSTELR
jgi:hypothetical protein